MKCTHENAKVLYVRAKRTEQGKAVPYVPDGAKRCSDCGALIDTR